MFRVLGLTLLVTTTIAQAIDWNGNWATACDFIGNDLTNTLSTREDCADRCASTADCTHYTWTNYENGTCWMKQNSVSKNDAIPKNDQGAVCGITAGGVDRSITGAVSGAADGLVSGAVGGGIIVDNVGGVLSTNISGVLASAINWNGNNWAASCQFIGNDLANALTTAEDCSGRCAVTPGCTHYTWTIYNGGTCWMKTNSVSKGDAVPQNDQGAVCGVVIKTEGGGLSANVTGVLASAINWNGNNWAVSCHFIGNDLTNALTSAKDCGGRCAVTPGCTHYTWTNYKGGTCWMKKNLVSKNDAIPRFDQGAVCGVVIGNIGVGLAGAFAINWNGNNWATSCHFIGNDLTNVRTSSKDCGGRCAATPGCTHYTWTNYNGGTCWMKKNSVSKSDAVPKHDHGAICGVTIGNTVGVGGIGTFGINWNGNNWATSCHFIGNDLTNVRTNSKDCGGRCAATPGCTHWTWTNYNGGTCWLKKNSVSKNDAVPRHDQGAICGVVIGNAIGVGGVGIGGASVGGVGVGGVGVGGIGVGGIGVGGIGVGGVGASGINWNGNNWVNTCDLLGNNDVTKISTSPEDCGWRCRSTPGCTHYSWNNYNGGTCWIKRNSDVNINVITNHHQGMFSDYFGRPMPHYKQITINLI